MIVFKHKGNLNKTETFLKRASQIDYLRILDKYGRAGVVALASSTPVDSGKTANSWTYNVEINKGKFTLTWSNSNVVDGVPVAVLIQYGHGTKNGGYVQGRDFIKPTIKPIFDKIAEDAWQEVSRL